MTVLAPAFAAVMAVRLARAGLAGVFRLILLAATGCSALTSLAGLSSRRPLKAAWRTMPAPGPSGELDLGHELGRDPDYAGLLGRRGLAGERAFGGRQRVEALEQILGVARIEAGADAADVNEMITLENAGDQRAQRVGTAAPAADHHLVAGAALGLGPGLGAALSGRGVRGVWR